MTPVFGIGQELAKLICLRVLIKKSCKAAAQFTAVPGVSLRLR